VGNDRAGYWTRTHGLAPATTLTKVITDAADKSPSASASVQAPTPAGNQSQPSPQKTPAEAAASYFTNTVLTTQDNKQIRFYDDMLKGKTVVINFMFTTCTGVCPPMTANLQKVQQQLGDRVGRDINMISLTVDPTIDTPEVMKKYATNFKAGPGWYFLSGDKQNVDVVLRKLGGYVEDKNQHNSLLIIGNVKTGQWAKVFAMAKPVEIATAILQIADGK
jgi:cytochrome oxidase Cu insertion factor (SCO1/SenC/PrrC family)